MNRNVWITVGFIVVAIAAFYAGKTGFWGMTRSNGLVG